MIATEDVVPKGGAQRLDLKKHGQVNRNLDLVLRLQFWSADRRRVLDAALVPQIVQTAIDLERGA